MTNSTLERAQAKNREAADGVSKAARKRDAALDALLRAELRYRKAVKAVTRTQKRFDRLREQARAVRAAKVARRESEKAQARQGAVIGADIAEALGI